MTGRFLPFFSAKSSVISIDIYKSLGFSGLLNIIHPLSGNLAQADYTSACALAAHSHGVCPLMGSICILSCHAMLNAVYAVQSDYPAPFSLSSHISTFSAHLHYEFQHNNLFFCGFKSQDDVGSGFILFFSHAAKT